MKLGRVVVVVCVLLIGEEPAEEALLDCGGEVRSASEGLIGLSKSLILTRSPLEGGEKESEVNMIGEQSTVFAGSGEESEAEQSRARIRKK